MKHQILSLILLMSIVAKAQITTEKREFFADWFISMASYDSQSQEPNDPSRFTITPGQMDVAKFVVKKLNSLYPKQIASNKLKIELSDSGYVYISIPNNTGTNIPSILFMAHLDVTPEAPGGLVKPIRHDNYDGREIALPAGITLSPSSTDGQHLNNCIGKTVITSDGSTLLGADDKAGCTILMGLVDQLMTTNTRHGQVYIVLSQNEDVGLAADGINIQYLGGKSPDYVIDIDGDDVGEFSIGNFTAVGRRYIFHGNNVHPGNGKKGGYADALTAAAMFIGLMPPEKHPSASEGEQGYIHCYSLKHPVDSLGREVSTDYVVDSRLRYFKKEEGDSLRSAMDAATVKVKNAYPNVVVEVVPEVLQYENIAYSMHPLLPTIIAKAASNLGIKMQPVTTRGGTTACMMAAKGLNGGPCLYSGQQAPHSCYEWTCIEDLIEMSNLCLGIITSIK